MLDDYIVNEEARKKCINLRNELGLSQSQVADILGYGKSNISMFERGKNKSLSLYMRYISLLEELNHGENHS